MDPRASCMQGKCCTSELQPWPFTRSEMILINIAFVMVTFPWKEQVMKLRNIRMKCLVQFKVALFQYDLLSVLRCTTTNKKMPEGLWPSLSGFSLSRVSSRKSHVDGWNGKKLPDGGCLDRLMSCPLMSSAH